MNPDEPQVLGWTVDIEPCDQCHDVQYGVRFYVEEAGGTISSVWYCGESDFTRRMMDKARQAAAT